MEEIHYYCYMFALCTTIVIISVVQQIFNIPFWVSSDVCVSGSLPLSTGFRLYHWLVRFYL